jgi:hypothetical protein
MLEVSRNGTTEENDPAFTFQACAVIVWRVVKYDQAKSASTVTTIAIAIRSALRSRHRRLRT